ncbi:MAG: type II toxin-antitoxin system VapC family toxin [Candidatus Hydrogenedentes bacterium]|nr:type II toxin-antitoxin system VapC family toxin [Candidatus Hydrogenedentota bacterium]
MILLDTHVWVWWVQGGGELSPKAIEFLDGAVESGIGVHVISCWEVAMLHAGNRLSLPCHLDEWLDQALRYPGVQLMPLSRTVAVNACRLPGEIHRDPADRMLIAAAIELACTLVTADKKILAYEHVRSLHPDELES